MADCFDNVRFHLKTRVVK